MMEAQMETPQSHSDSESAREQYRRFRKRLSSSGGTPLQGSSGFKFKEASLLFDGNSIQRPPNAAILLEEIKQEVSQEFDGFDVSSMKAPDSSRRRISVDSHGMPALNSVFDSGRQSLRSVKLEDEVMADGGESSFSLFASLFDYALRGVMPFSDLILHFQNSCRTISESVTFGGPVRHRIVGDRLMRQKARLFLDEAASWSLLWHLFGKSMEDLPPSLILSPTTSHQEACQFVATDTNAQLCLRIVLWLEGLASVALDMEKKLRGSHVGSYLPSSGIWHHTQRHLKKGLRNDSQSVKHLDFDAATREAAQLFPDDKKQDESLLEDVWVLIRAGRIDEACDLCRSAGQPWRAASLCPFGGLDLFPSVEALQKNVLSRVLQAIELESGIGRQWTLWKWASYCAAEKIADRDGGKFECAVYASQCSNVKRMLPVCTDWESACWALAKSWLDVQVDSVLMQFQRGRVAPSKMYCDDVNGSPNQEAVTAQVSGPENWPSHVNDQQPQDLPSLFQKLHSSEFVNESVSRACKEQHRQIQMGLMMGHLGHLLDLLWSWICPMEDDQNVWRPHGDPQIICFSAHLVLILRYLLADDLDDSLREKLTTTGDRIIYMYSMFLFSKQHEELVGIYASQLQRHRCIDLFVHMMELRLNDSVQVKYKIFLSAMEHLPFSQGDDSKACFEDIIDRVLSRSREIETSKHEERSSDVAEHHRLQSLQKAIAIQWLCFTPPSTIDDVEMINGKLLFKALMHSNILFREFALIAMWRVPKMPIGAHKLLSFLAEPLKQPIDALINESDAFENMNKIMHEFEDWREYYACDATYRNWLQAELENADIPPGELSADERDKSAAAARETLESSLSLLLRNGSPWLNASEETMFKSTDSVFVELFATAMLCLPSGECLCPDATLCTTLSSALYASVSEEELLNRQLTINVAISSKDNFCIEVSMRCVAVNGDGLGLHESNDGGILASALAAGFKGELCRFQAGVTMEISRLDAWYSKEDGSPVRPATYVVKGLCRRCCLPELILRCMQVSVSLAESGDLRDHSAELINLVASEQSRMYSIFSRHQLQEFLMFERECTLYKMEKQEEDSPVDV